MGTITWDNCKKISETQILGSLYPHGLKIAIKRHGANKANCRNSFIDKKTYIAGKILNKISPKYEVPNMHEPQLKTQPY